MSTEYLWFMSAFALALTAASLVAFTQPGQAFILASVQRLGRWLGVCPWGLLHTFGHELDASALSPAERATLAESYIASAESQTITAARVTVWVLISGCVFTALTGVAIAVILPPYVEAGVWSYNLYSQIASWMIRANVAAGLGMGIGLVSWLARRTLRLNRTDGCSVARDFVLAGRSGGLQPPMAEAVDAEAYPRLTRLLRDVT